MGFSVCVDSVLEHETLCLFYVILEYFKLDSIYIAVCFSIVNYKINLEAFSDHQSVLHPE